MKQNFFRLFFVFFFLITSCVVLFFSQIRQKETFLSEEDIPWYEQTTEEFYKNFDRPVDPIHMIFFENQTQNKTNKETIEWIRNDLKKYTSQVQDGHKISKNSSIVIAGLIRNGALNITLLRERCKELTSHFKEYKIVIVENNSIDGTRQFLLEWASEDPNVVILCKDVFAVNIEECDISLLFPESENLGSSPLPKRIQKMSYLRNVYLQHVKHYYSHFDYFCVMDLDLTGDIFQDGFFQSIHHLHRDKKLDAIACNGMLRRSTTDQYFYYDSFAHIEIGDPYVFENQSAKSHHDRYVHTFITQKYTSSMKLDKVRSAFGGVVLYKMKSVQNATYDFSPNYFSCEHSFFHLKMSVVVNPRFIFLISQNGF